jgi:hypothetical protein
VRWQPHACSTLEVPRPTQAYVIRRTAPEVIERVRQLARDHTASQIAERLHDEGYLRSQGGAFSASKVEWLRYAYGIKSACPLGPAACPTGQRGDGRYSTQAAAVQLNVSVSTIVDWCKAGKLDGIQVAPRGPWWVELTPEVRAALRKPIRQYKPRQAHKPPATSQGIATRKSHQGA